MKNLGTECETTCCHVREAENVLARLARAAFQAGLNRVGLIFAQVRLELLRLEAGLPLGETDLFYLELFNSIFTPSCKLRKRG